MTVINSNSAALRAQNGSRIANEELDTAMARLSSGKRINSASDDAAGLAVSDSMTSQINGMNQAISNANDGVSLAQTADGSLGEVTNMMQRIRELSVQSASGTYSDSDRANMQAEVSQLNSQINLELTGTTFNGVQLFTTGAGGQGTSTAIQIGTEAGDTVNIDIGNLDLSALNAPVTMSDGSEYTVKAGDNLSSSVYTATSSDTGDSKASIADLTEIDPSTGKPKLDASGNAIVDQSITAGNSYKLAAGDVVDPPAGTMLTGTSVATVAGANQVMTSMDGMLAKVDTIRAGLGAAESRLNSVVNNLTNSVTNLTDANSRIADADFSVETTNLAKAQILNQASTAMLAQANQSAQGVLKLLQQ